MDLRSTMNLSAASAGDDDAPPCAACATARAAWLQGGPHLSCRACEIRAVAESSTDARHAFYAALVAEARAA